MSEAQDDADFEVTHLDSGGAVLDAPIGRRIHRILIGERDGLVTLHLVLSEGGPPEVLRYLTPVQAMGLAKALERCAIAALRKSA
jgi:hypothetical protein